MKSITEKKGGFTLVELLVVIAIIAILAGMLMPVLNDMIEKGRRTDCINNQRQIGLALAMYRHGYGAMPDHGPMGNPYGSDTGYDTGLYRGGNGQVKTDEIFACPSSSQQIDGACDYLRGDWNLVRRGGGVVIMGDARANHSDDAYVFLFADGHVISHPGTGDEAAPVTNVRGAASAEDDMYADNTDTIATGQETWLRLND